mgnify:FL=1
MLALASGFAFWFSPFRNIETFKSLNFKSLNIETEDQRRISVPISDQSADTQETYTNPKYGFSFNYSKEFSASEFSEGEADVILIKDVTGDGFQISITPFDEPFDSAQGKSGPITKERILKDIPNMRIGNDKEISVGGETDSISSPQKALSFMSQDTSLETFEIWFVRGGNLYQISAFPSFSNKLEEIIKTWKFQ